MIALEHHDRRRSYSLDEIGSCWAGASGPSAPPPGSIRWSARSFARDEASEQRERGGGRGDLVAASLVPGRDRGADA
jgi:hypothetical protein